jgi:hypothetical protein
MQFYLDQLTSDLKLTCLLEHTATPAGVFIHPGQDKMNQIDNLLATVEPTLEAEQWVVTGTTDSKLYAIENSLQNMAVPNPIVAKMKGNAFGETEQIVDFDIKQYLNQPIQIAGTDIIAVITMYEKARKEYTLYADTPFPIKYVDFPDGKTTFMFSKVAEETNENNPLLNKFSGLVEEPKIESSVFIERGVVNVFEPFIKLKKVKSLNEMTKFGFGYFKINKQGFNF